MQRPTFLEELMAAGRGMLALLIGDKQARNFFDFSRRGLVSSFIALLIAVGIQTYLPFILSKSHDSAVVSLAQSAIVFVLQLGCVAIVLRQAGRLDTLAAYVVVDNWISFYVSLIFGALLAAGLGTDGDAGDALTIVFSIVVIVLEVNMARKILTLSPLQIAMLIIARTVGAIIALGITWLIFGLPPDVAAQLNSLSAS
jgi:hypothetical protein